MWPLSLLMIPHIAFSTLKSLNFRDSPYWHNWFGRSCSAFVDGRVWLLASYGCFVGLGISHTSAHCSMEYYSSEQLWWSYPSRTVG